MWWQDNIERVAIEHELLSIHFPFLEMGASDNYVVVKGTLPSNNLCFSTYFIEAFYPHDYGGGNRIRVFLPLETLKTGTPHLYSGDSNEICLEHDQLDYDHTILDTLAWTQQWLACYEEFKLYGRTW